jgi:hypothetical protein
MILWEFPQLGRVLMTRSGMARVGFLRLASPPAGWRDTIRRQLGRGAREELSVQCQRRWSRRVRTQASKVAALSS